VGGEYVPQVDHCEGSLTIFAAVGLVNNLNVKLANGLVKALKASAQTIAVNPKRYFFIKLVVMGIKGVTELMGFPN